MFKSLVAYLQAVVVTTRTQVFNLETLTLQELQCTDEVVATLLDDHAATTLDSPGPVTIQARDEFVTPPSEHHHYQRCYLLRSNVSPWHTTSTS